jgi:ATP-binding cassette subfamily B protein
VERSGRAPVTGRRVAGLFAPHRLAVGLVAGLVVLSAGLNVLVPLLTQVVFDRALFGPGGPDLELLGLLAAAAAGIAVMVGVVDLVEARMSESIAHRILHTLREQTYRSLQRQPLEFFGATRGGELQSRLVGDTAEVEEAIKETTPSIISTVAGIAFILAAMLSLSYQLTAVSVLMSPFLVWAAARASRAIRRVAAAAQETRARLTSLAAERLSLPGVTLARVYGRQGEEAARFAAESGRLSRLEVRTGMLAQRVMSIAQAFFLVSPYLVFLAAGRLDHVSAGTLAAFAILQTRLYQPLGQMLRLSTELRAALAAFDRVFAYLDLPAEARPRSGRCAGGATGGAAEVKRLGEVKRLRATSVAFAYQVAGSRRQTWSLRDVSLDLAAGAAALVVGPSGSGKTTLAYLLAGLYAPATGSIHIDDVDTADIDVAEVHRCVRIAGQEPFLLQGTIAENLRYGDAAATPQELERVCRMVRIHDRIATLPDGYASPVGERGALFSGGERQRIALARALLADPAVLVLDEATSALDAATERAVVTAILRHRRPGITVMISHRIGVMQAFDTVVVLDRGRVVEHGRPAELATRPDGYCLRMLRGAE